MSNHTSGNLATLVPTVNAAQSNNSFENEALQSPSKVNELASKIHFLESEKAMLDSQIKSLKQELLDICGHKEDGSVKFNTQDFIVTTTGKLYRKITDPAQLSALAPDVIRTKTELDLRAFKSLAAKNPMLYQRATAFVETKAGLPSVKIETNKKD